MAVREGLTWVMCEQRPEGGGSEPWGLWGRAVQMGKVSVKALRRLVWRQRSERGAQ